MLFDMKIAKLKDCFYSRKGSRLKLDKYNAVTEGNCAAVIDLFGQVKKHRPTMFVQKMFYNVLRMFYSFGRALILLFMAYQQTTIYLSYEEKGSLGLYTSSSDVFIIQSLAFLL